jgi:hypothetical protein
MCLEHNHKLTILCGLLANASPAIRFLAEQRSTIPQEYGFQTALFDILESGLSLLASEEGSLSQLNQLGIFHKFDPRVGNSFGELNSLQNIPSSWISRGTWPGIWCTLYSPRYTFSIATRPPLVSRVEFAEGFKLYDPSSESSKQLWMEWELANKQKSNKWESDFNSKGISMKHRVEQYLAAPGHVEFYHENGFGAIVGREDYMAIVIIDEAAIHSLSNAFR